MHRINDVIQLWLGIQGENKSRTIEIDMTDWIVGMPNGSPSIWIKRPGDATPTATGATFDMVTNLLTWQPDEVDTYVAGEGTAEIRMTEGTVIKKTKEIRIAVSPAVTGGGTVLGSDWQSYINEVDRLKSLATAAATAAGASEEAAETAAETATEEASAAEAARDAADASATAAAGSAETARQAASVASGAATAAQNYKDQALSASGAAQTAQSQAEIYKNQASTSASNAQTAESHARTYANNASSSASQAQSSASSAAGSAASANSAATRAETARSVAEQAKASAIEARTEAVSAKNTAEAAKTNAETAATAAAGSATAAAGSATSAAADAETAEDAKDAAVAAKTAAEAARDAALTMIDDTAGAGDTDKTWSADKSAAEITDLKDALSFTNNVISDQLGEAKSLGVSVAKGTTKKAILTFDLFKDRKVYISFSLASGINKSTYAYLYDSAGNNIWSSDSIGIPANTTSRDIVFTPSQDYRNAQILYTISSSASSDAIISVRVVEAETLKEKVEHDFSQFKSATEKTYNIFDPFGKYYANGSECIVDGNTVTVTSKTADTYRYVWFLIERQGFTKVTVCPYTAAGTGDAKIRIGGKATPEGSETWIGSPVNAGASATFDVSSYNYIVVGLYSVYSSGGSVGKYTTYSNIMIVTGETVNDYFVPCRGAIDYPVRKRIAEEDEIHPADYFGGSLATVSNWESGTISDSTGEDQRYDYNIRTKMIRTARMRKLFVRVFYETPDSTVDVQTTDNYNYRSMYIYQYRADKTFISRLSATTYTKVFDLDEKCEFVRMVIYTRYDITAQGVDISVMMPGTIDFYSADDEHFLPRYYESHLAQQAALIEGYARAAGGNSEVFAFVTDQHAQSDTYRANNYNQGWSPAILHRLSELTNIPMVVCGGDFDHLGRETKYYIKLLRKHYSGEIHCAVGNHEFLNDNDGKSLYFDLDVFNQDEVGDRDHHYYYFDNPQTKIRHIVLASWRESVHQETGAGSKAAQDGYYGEFGETQREWLQNVALDMPEGYKAIVFAHHLYLLDYVETGGVVTYNAKINNYGEQDVLSILANDPDVICIIQGHTHNDRIIKAHDQIGGNLPVIMTTSDKNLVYYWTQEGADPVPEDHWFTNRATGTVNEQAMDVIIINQNTRTINVVRIGALADTGVNDVFGTDASGFANERAVTY